jgi:putative ABC transport system permease protein
MFFTYLLRELRRRKRQAVYIALGLALGIGLVITVTAASTGVRTAQGTVLHSLYGVGTDITVTQAPAYGSGHGPTFSFGSGSGFRPGAKVNSDVLTAAQAGTLKASSVTAISRLRDVSAASGALVLTDTHFTGTIPSSAASRAAGGTGGTGSFSVNSFSVDGVQLSGGDVGVLSSGQITSGRTFTAADATSSVAVVDSGYARQQGLKTGSPLTIAGKKFTVIGIVSMPQGASTPDVFIPLAPAQSLSGMTGEVSTIYVAADSASHISTVAAEISALLPKATVTTSSSLASEVTGSLASASSLANNLGRWLSVAVLAVAFGLAALLMMGTVTRRVREFGTLKALGWRSGRVIGQVMGEALALGVIGGAAGIALGFGGAAIIDAVATPLTASTGPPAGSAAPGAGRAFQRLGSGAGPLANTVTVHLSAPVTLGVIAAAVLLAVAGGLIAGLFGGWRAARLRPAAALGAVG